MNVGSQRTIRLVADYAGLPLPANDDWLSDAERAELSSWRVPARRKQWLAGRWIAKRLLCRRLLAEELRRVEVLSRTAQGLGSRPRVCVDGQRLDRQLSISHTGRSVLVGLGAPGARIGVDLAMDVPNCDRFRNAWFSPREKAWLNALPQLRAPILWSLKEAIFKACAEGHAWNPRAVEVLAVDNDTVYSEVDGLAIAPLTTWIRPTGGGAATVVGDLPRGSLLSPERDAGTHEVASCL